MSFVATFSERENGFVANFGEVNNISDGGYERGYADGLAARTYETWTITLVDGTTVEKEVALL